MTAVTQESAVQPGSPAAARWLPLSVLMAGTFMAVLDFFVVNVALPAIQRGLGAGAGAIEWVAAGYGLTMAVFMVTGGRLGDQYGRRRMFAAGLALYAAVDRAGLIPAGPGGALYPAELFTEERGEVTAFVPVPSLPPAPPAPGGPVLLEIPAVEAAVMLHEGPMDDLDRTYGALGTVLAERAIGVEGPIREYYLTGFRDTDDESRHRTEVCWPVFQTRGQG